MEQTNELRPLLSSLMTKRNIDINNYIEKYNGLLKLANYAKQNPECKDSIALLKSSEFESIKKISKCHMLYNSTTFENLITKYPIIDNYLQNKLDSFIGMNYQLGIFDKYDGMTVRAMYCTKFDVNKNTLITEYRLHYRVGCTIKNMLNSNNSNTITSEILMWSIPCSLELFNQIINENHNDIYLVKQLPQSIVDDCLLLLLNYCESEMTQ